MIRLLLVFATMFCAWPGSAAQLTDVLAEREGFGAKTVGGAGGPVFHVTTLQDSGPGSLREGLSRHGPLWIVFDVDGVIELQSPIDIQSYKTVDGRNRSIQIKTSNHSFTALKFRKKTELILLNLNLDDGWPDWREDSEGSDGLAIFASSNIWVHRCRFAQWRDGAIDIDGNAHDISVTRSRFQRIYQALNWRADRATFAHNWCQNVIARCAQIIGGTLHSYNNLIEAWGKSTIQNSKDGAILVSEHNIFVPGGHAQVNHRRSNGRIITNGNFAIGRVEFIGNDRAPDIGAASSARVSVCAPQDGACWQRMRQDIETRSGPMRR